MNATQIYEHLVKESFLPATVSVDSVQRFIRFNDLKSARDPNLRDRKAYEEDEFGKIWQALIVKVVVSKNLYSCFDRLSDIVLYLT